MRYLMRVELFQDNLAGRRFSLLTETKNGKSYDIQASIQI